MPYSAQEKALILERFMQNQSEAVRQRCVRRTMDRNSHPSMAATIQKFRKSGAQGWKRENRKDSGGYCASAFDVSRKPLGKYEECCSCTWNTTHYGTANFKAVLAFVPLQDAKSTRPFDIRLKKRLHFTVHFQNNPVGYS